MHYGSHVDDALIDGMRSDVSFTCSCPIPRATRAASW